MGELLRPVAAKRCARDLRLRMQRKELGDGVGNEACINSYRLTKESSMWRNQMLQRVQAKLFIEFYIALILWNVRLPLCLHIFQPEGLIDRAQCAHARPARLRSSCEVADVTGPVILRLPSRNSRPLT